MLHDLQTTCPALKLTIRPPETAPRFFDDVKAALFTSYIPTCANHPWKMVMPEVFENPKRQVDPGLVQLLRHRENALMRYNFVNCAVSRVCNAPTNEVVNDLSIMAADVTAHCHSLASDWLGGSKNHHSFNLISLTQINMTTLTFPCPSVL
jgi:hypothetical protein